MDRLERQQLKQDRFVTEVGHTVDYVKDHRKQVIQYVVGGVVLLLLVAGFFVYRSYAHGQREAALNEALRAQNGQVGQAQNEYIKAYPTQADKDKDVVKQFTDVMNKYSGSDEAYIAEYLLGTSAADRGNLADAERYLKHVADNASKTYASQAKLSLSQVYLTQNKSAEAEKLLRELQADPTVMVSKEQATIALARVIALKNPAEARKMLEPLQGERAAVGRTAITAISELPR